VPETNKENENFPSTYDCSDSDSCKKLCSDLTVAQLEEDGSYFCGHSNELNASYSLVYGSGTVNGYLVKDDISFFAQGDKFS